MSATMQTGAYAVVTVFFILSTISILLRIYSRSVVIKSFGWDDWCMVSILFFNCGHQAILYYFLHFGGGLRVAHVMANNPEWISKIIHALFAEEIYYAWMHWVIKTAFLLFYLRFATKTFRKLVFCTMGLNTVLTIITWFIYCFQCTPLDAFFNPANHPNVKCINNKVLAFVPAAFSIFVDVLIVVLPIKSLWAIQVSLRKRLMLIGIVCLGAVVVVISCLRLIILLEFQKFTDITYTLGKIIIISSIELEVAIIAANAPSLKVLFGGKPTVSAGSHMVLNKCGTQSGGSQSKRQSQKGPSYLVSSHYHPEPNVPLEGTKGATASDMSNDSEENLWKHDSGIMVTQSVGIETHPARPVSGKSLLPKMKENYNSFDSV